MKKRDLISKIIRGVVIAFVIFVFIYLVLLFFPSSQQKQYPLIYEDFSVDFSGKSSFSGLDCRSQSYEKLSNDFRTKYNWDCLLESIHVGEPSPYSATCRCFSTGEKPKK